MQTQKRLLRYVLKYKARLILAMILGALMAGCTLVMSEFIRWFVMVRDGQESILELRVVDYGINHGWFTQHNAAWGLMWIVAVGIVIIHIPKGLLTYFIAYLVASVTNRMGADVRDEMYSHLHTLPMSFFHRSRIGDLMARMSYDVI